MKIENISHFHQSPKTVEFLQDTFRNVHEINTLLCKFEKQASFLREISVNSAIAAGHVNEEASALSEIAKQIGVLSNYLSESVRDAHLITGKISNCVLSSIASSDEKDKMIIALCKINSYSSNTSAVIREVVTKIEQEISLDLDTAKSSLHNLNPMLTRLKQVINRTWSLIMALKVSSGVDEGEEDSFFIPIAKSLEKMAEDSMNYTEQITRLIFDVGQNLTNLSSSTEEEPYGT